MEARTLTITLQPDWKAALSASAGKAFKADFSLGDRLNFESAAAFFCKLTDGRYIVDVLPVSGLPTNIAQIFSLWIWRIMAPISPAGFGCLIAP